jgi:putative endonuclease
LSGLRRLGADAEDRAAVYLIACGYTIVKRGYKGPSGEIDILALHDDVLVVVEVKERTKAGSPPEQSVTAAKARRLAAAARQYLQSVDELDREIRFDLICYDPSGVRHHVDAFRP